MFEHSIGERTRRPHYVDIQFAPRDGTKVKLRVKDGYGTYILNPYCAWRGGQWVFAKTGRPVAPVAIGFKIVEKYCGYEE